MTGPRSNPEEKAISGRELWTVEGTNTLIRKLQNDPGLAEDARQQFIDSVRLSALEKGIGKADDILNYKPPREVKVTPKPEPRGHMPPLTKEIRAKAKEQGSREREALLAYPAPAPTPQPAVSAPSPGKSFDDYQDFTSTVAVFPQEVAVPYTVLGLNGEAAEVAGKLVGSLTKTILAADGLAVDQNRDNLYNLNNLLRGLAKIGADAEKLKKELRKGEKKLPPLKALSDEEKKELAKEVGDVLWYCAQLSKCLGFKLSDIATMNVDKLTSRKARGVLHGNGDNR